MDLTWKRAYKIVFGNVCLGEKLQTLPDKALLSWRQRIILAYKFRLNTIDETKTQLSSIFLTENISIISSLYNNCLTDYDGGLKVYDLETSTYLRSLTHTSEEKRSTPIPPLHQLLIHRREDYLRIWNVTTGDTLRILRGHCGTVTALSIARNYAQDPLFSPQRTRAASSAEDLTIRLWDIDDCYSIYSLPVHKAAFAITFADLQRKMIAVQGNTATIIDTEYGKFLQTCKGHGDEIRAVNAGLEWNKLFVSGGLDREVRLWDSLSGECIRIFPHNHQINRLRLEGKQLLSTTEHSISIWDTDHGNLLRSWDTEFSVTAVDWDPGRLLIGSGFGVFFLDFTGK